MVVLEPYICINVRNARFTYRLLLILSVLTIAFSILLSNDWRIPRHYNMEYIARFRQWHFSMNTVSNVSFHDIFCSATTTVSLSPTKSCRSFPLWMDPLFCLPVLSWQKICFGWLCYYSTLCFKWTTLWAQIDVGKEIWKAFSHQSFQFKQFISLRAEFSWSLCVTCCNFDVPFAKPELALHFLAVKLALWEL